jgi:hypothetical protein
MVGDADTLRSLAPRPPKQFGDAALAAATLTTVAAVTMLPTAGFTPAA